MSLFIKYVFTGVSVGFAAPIVLLCAHARMGVGQFAAYKLRRLSTATNPDAPSGYVCFTTTRAGNIAFWSWYWLKVLIPFIDDCRSKCSDVPQGVACPAINSIDGEQQVLQAIMEHVDPETGKKICDIMTEKNIRLLKSPAGCSLIVNPADAQPTFRVKPTLMRQVSQNIWTVRVLLRIRGR
jgi:hypothetical protein